MEDVRNMIGWGLGGWGWWWWGGGGVIVLAILSYFFCPVGARHYRQWQSKGG